MTKLTWMAATVFAVATLAPGQDSLNDPLNALGSQRPANPVAEHLTVRAVASDTEVARGRTFHLAVVVEIADGWAYYSPNPGGSDFTPLPAGVEVDAGELQAGEPLWPAAVPHEYTLGDKTYVNNAYEHRAVIYVPITVPDDAPEGLVTLTVQPTGQICGHGQCLRLTGLSATTRVAVAEATIANPAWHGDIVDGLAAARPAGAMTPEEPPTGTVQSLGGKLSISVGLWVALLAGLTLNIMPCVLPIIPLRIYSLVEMAQESRRRYVTLGLAFAGGIVLFFVALAVASAAVKLASGQVIDLNEHFQYPSVRIGIALILTALAANLFGLFTVTVPSKLAAAGPDGRRGGHVAGVGMGFMMAVLATPCSFAYLAVAVTWAQTQPLWLGTVAILLIGIGMAVPHVLLAAFPGLLRRLPKPGRWMELFKQTMGFLLLPAVLILLGTLPTAELWPLWVAGFCVVLTFGLWMWGGWVRYDAPLSRKLIIRGLAVALVVVAGVWMLPRPKVETEVFKPFGESQLTQARQAGQAVVVEVSAAWCFECKILYHEVFEDPNVVAALKQPGVLTLSADVTDAAGADSQWLKSQGYRTTLPLTLIYPADGGLPRVVAGRYGVSDFLAWLTEARRSDGGSLEGGG